MVGVVVFLAIVVNFFEVPVPRMRITLLRSAWYSFGVPEWAVFCNLVITTSRGVRVIGRIALPYMRFSIYVLGLSLRQGIRAGQAPI